MALIKKKVVHDAGITNPTELPDEINDGGRFVSAPKSAFAVGETISLVFTDNTKVLEGPAFKLDIADGSVRPGTAG